MVNVFTEWDGNSHHTLIDAMVAPKSGLLFSVGSESKFQGHKASVSVFDSIDFGGVKLGSGVLFTSGDGTPALPRNSTGSDTGVAIRLQL